MRASRHIPRRVDRARAPLWSSAVFTAASGLLACEGKGGEHAAGSGASGGLTGTGGIRHGRYHRHGRERPGTDDPGRVRHLPFERRRAGRHAAGEASTVQYRNTVRDLLNASGLSAVATEVAPMLAAIPDDSTVAFRGLDARISSDTSRATSTSPARSPTPPPRPARASPRWRGAAPGRRRSRRAAWTCSWRRSASARCAGRSTPTSWRR